MRWPANPFPAFRSISRISQRRNVLRIYQDIYTLGALISRSLLLLRVERRSTFSFSPTSPAKSSSWLFLSFAPTSDPYSENLVPDTEHMYFYFSSWVLPEYLRPVQPSDISISHSPCQLARISMLCSQIGTYCFPTHLSFPHPHNTIPSPPRALSAAPISSFTILTPRSLPRISQHTHKTPSLVILPPSPLASNACPSPSLSPHRPSDLQSADSSPPLPSAQNSTSPPRTAGNTKQDCPELTCPIPSSYIHLVALTLYQDLAALC